MRSVTARLSAALSGLAQGALWVACTALIAMTLVEAWQVYARYVLNDSPSWTEPVALLLMSTCMMLGAAAGVRADAHFGFVLALHVAPPAIRRVFVTVANLVIAAIGSLLAFWGAELLVDGWDVRMAGAPLHQGLFFLPICAGGALIAVFALEKLLCAPQAHAPPSGSGAALTAEG